MQQLTLWESAKISHGTFGNFHPSSIIGRVHFVYSLSQRAIDHDDYLIYLYQQEFGELARTSGVERVGRLLRNKHGLFNRSPDREHFSRQAQEVMRHKFA